MEAIKYTNLNGEADSFVPAATLYVAAPSRGDKWIDIETSGDTWHRLEARVSRDDCSTEAAEWYANRLKATYEACHGITDPSKAIEAARLLAAAAAKYAEMMGPRHGDDCPGDRTCNCPESETHKALDKALAAWGAQ